MAPHYASALGKNANCQTLVSLTLASREVPVIVGLRLFLPESWTSDPTRLDRGKVPEDRRDYRTRPEIALAEIDRVRSGGVRFGRVLADAGYGLSAPFRQGLCERGLLWVVGIPYKQKVSWRKGTRGKRAARFAAVLARVAAGPPQRIHNMGAQHPPGEEAWRVGEHRSSGERKYYLSNLPANAMPPLPQTYPT